MVIEVVMVTITWRLVASLVLYNATHRALHQNKSGG